MQNIFEPGDPINQPSLQEEPLPYRIPGTRIAPQADAVAGYRR
jgi:hypothetical protein